MAQGAYASTDLTARLVAGDTAGDFRYVGLADRRGPYVVDVNGQQRRYDLDRMTAWLDGFTDGRGHQAGALEGVPAGRGMGQLVELLTAPTLADQCRIAIRAAMDAAEIDATGLAARANVTRKTVADALRYGPAQTLSVKMAQQLMAAAAGRWHVEFLPDRYQGALANLTNLAPADPDAPTRAAGPALEVPTRPEPDTLTRLRALAVADSRGLARWTDDRDVTSASSKGGRVHLTLRVAGRPEPVRLRAWVDLVPYLLGLADAVDPDAAASIAPLDV